MRMGSWKHMIVKPHMIVPSRAAIGGFSCRRLGEVMVLWLMGVSSTLVPQAFLCARRPCLGLARESPTAVFEVRATQ